MSSASTTSTSAATATGWRSCSSPRSAALFTCGLTTIAVAIWAFVEFVVILCGGIDDGYGRRLA